MVTFIGIDSGGIKAFGWRAMYVAFPKLLKSRIETGTYSSPSEAIPEIEKLCETQPIAAGIDAPLYRARNGERKSDQIIREAVTKAGGSSSTVSHVNSLRGACLVQGVLSAVALTEKWPQISITESHPKALLSIWSDTAELIGHFEFTTDHERDAALGAYAAFAFMAKWPGWIDLLGIEESYFIPSGKTISYWFPKT